MSDSSDFNSLAGRGEAALEHAGVKGMKWGVRKNRSSSGGSKADKFFNSKPVRANDKVVNSKAFDVADIALLGSNVPTSKQGAAVLALRTGARIGVRLAVGGSLAAIGVPATVSAVAMAAANPELIELGANAAKLKLDEMGMIDMSTLDKFKAKAEITEFRVKSELQERATSSDLRDSGITTIR